MATTLEETTPRKRSRRNQKREQNHTVVCKERQRRITPREGRSREGVRLTQGRTQTNANKLREPREEATQQTQTRERRGKKEQEPMP